MAPINKEKPGLAAVLADLRRDETIAIVNRKLESGVESMKILEELREGLRIVGSRFENNEYFLSELVAGGELFKDAFEILRPSLQSDAQKKPIGKFVIGTVKGDIHDLGKDIVSVMLECNGFQVYDLGVDVAPEEFVKKAIEVNADLVGLSALLTGCIDSMKETVKALEKSGLGDKIKVIIGGGIVDELVMRKVGADAYAGDALSAVKVAKEMLKA